VVSLSMNSLELQNKQCAELAYSFLPIFTYKELCALHYLELIGQYWYWTPQPRKVLPSTQYNPVLANIGQYPMLVLF